MLGGTLREAVGVRGWRAIQNSVNSATNAQELERTMNAGPGRPSGGGGGGRRRRRGRRPHNQRGQKPGPGLSRENKDGIYTAPMDHSSRAALAGRNNNNGHKGGRQRP